MREALSVLDECFPPRRRCAVEGALLDELLVTTFLAPLWDADLRGQPHLHLFATDATPVSVELWTLLYEFSEEKSCSVRLDWDASSMHPPEFRDSRAAVAGLVVDFCRGSKVSRIGSWKSSPASFGVKWTVVLGHLRVLRLVDSRVVLGSACKGRSSSRRVNFRLRRLGGLMLANNFVA